MKRANQAAPTPTPPVATADTPARYILATMLAFPDNEMTCTDLVNAQAQPPRFSREAIKNSLKGLLKTRKVSKFKDPDDGRNYWSRPVK